ncbi:N-acetylmannosamine kinase [Klebsiella aerogenes]|uniref:N-acetylmannosamine kinase n=1 Tax=Klebsiella aerogenes TaxID=548 RepID=UPI002073263F|nr:N-acetylmannosamine kinase [Klebsiella aerogenes]
MTTLAIDIGCTKLAAALIGHDLQLQERRELPTPASKTPDALQDALRGLVTPLQKKARQVAVASTGIIQEGVLQALNPQNLGGLLHFPLIQTLETITGLPTWAINDAQSATWAEYHALAGDIREMAFITLSTGVGGGIVSQGKLLIGTGGLAGHLGHTQADPHGPVCGCGRTGCVEAIASGRGIAAAARGKLVGCDAKAIFALAANGDEQALSLIRHSAQTIAHLIADVKTITDCQHVVIGGSVGLAEGYLAFVQQFLKQEPSAYHAKLSVAHYRHNAGLLGAALLAQGDER